jgi:hypothetical protein
VSKPVKNIFGIVALVLSGFFLNGVNILAFVNQPIWPVKAIIIGAFIVPAIFFLLLSSWCRGRGKFRRDLAIVLLATAGYGAFVILSFFCMLKSPDVLKQMPPDFFHQFGDVLSGALCFSLYLLLGVGLLLLPRKV